jgi:hypothetical protein
MKACICKAQVFFSLCNVYQDIGPKTELPANLCQWLEHPKYHSKKIIKSFSKEKL